jgi:1,4-dihydroxy-2-naphthoate octaprenyltransferase
MTRSTWLHLRIPFSVYLLPVFCFAVSQAPHVKLSNALLIAAILHLLAYPASQAFNSYYDRDEGSIGGLEKPPPVSRELLVVALVFDGLALLLGLLVGWRFAILLLVCGLASKAYSHPAIRLKARPWVGWFTVAFFQGALTYAMVTLGLRDLTLRDLWSKEIIFAAALTSLLIGGAYPMTQIYQHREDATRGDLTLSRRLGVRGSFLFCGATFALCTLGFLGYFSALGRMRDFWLLLAFLIPLAVYVDLWFKRVKRDPGAADFRSAMRLNQLSAASLIGYFSILTWLAH